MLAVLLDLDTPIEQTFSGELAAKLRGDGWARDVGDIAHIAALVAPRRITIRGGVIGGGLPLPHEALVEKFAITRAAFAQHEASQSLSIVVQDAR